jgi:hypothetical protein
MCVYKIDHVFLLLYFIFYFCFCSECCACRQSRLKPQGYHFLKLRVFRRCRSDEKEEECRCVWERHIHSYSFIITISRRLRMSFSLFSWASNVQLNKIHLCLTFLCFPPSPSLLSTSTVAITLIVVLITVRERERAEKRRKLLLL